MNAAANRLRTFSSYARKKRNTSALDNGGGTPSATSNTSADLARQTYYKSDAAKQNAQLTIGQTLLAILMAVLNFALVYWQQYLGGKTYAAIAAAGVSLICGSSIPYAQCC